MPNVRLDTIGQSGLARYGGNVVDEWHWRLKGKRGARFYREMRDNDAIIGASLWMLQAITRRAGVIVIPGAGPRGAQEAEYLESVLVDMSHTFADLTGEVLSMLWHGYAPFEVVYKIRRGPLQHEPEFRSRFDDNRYGWRKIDIRAQETIEDWEFDDEGGIRGMWQTAAPHHHKVFIPIEKMILFRTERNRNNPEGRSFLRNSARSYRFMKRMQEIEAIGLNRDLTGMPHGEMPSEYFSTTDPKKIAVRKKFESILAGITSGEESSILTPASEEDGEKTGWGFGLTASPGTHRVNPSDPIRRYQKDIAMSFLTQFLFLGMDGVGTQALAGESLNVVATSVGAILDNIFSTLNRFGVSPLYDLNGVADEDRASLAPGELAEADLDAFATRIGKYVDSMLLTPDPTLEAHIREREGLPDKDDDDMDLDDDELTSAEKRLLKKAVRKLG